MAHISMFEGLDETYPVMKAAALRVIGDTFTRASTHLTPQAISNLNAEIDAAPGGVKKKITLDETIPAGPRGWLTRLHRMAMVDTSGYHFYPDEKDFKDSGPFQAYKQKLAVAGVDVEVTNAREPWFFHNEMLPGNKLEPGEATLKYSRLKSGLSPQG